MLLTLVPAVAAAINGRIRKEKAVAERYADGSKKNDEDDDGDDDGGDGGPLAFLWPFLFTMLFWVFFLCIAIAVAVSCKAKPREYIVVVIDPWVYLMIRLVIPCVVA